MATQYNKPAGPTQALTGSFLAGGGQAALNGGQTASWLNLPQKPTGTFFGAGGQAVRGPDGSNVLLKPKGGGGGGGGYGRGGGGGYPNNGWADSSYPPKWYLNLTNWNIR